mgnify:CR=1 FL=1
MIKNKIHIASVRECTGCMACIDACGTKALTLVVGNDGHYYPKWNETLCVQCGRCEQTCPVANKLDYAQNTAQSKPFAAWSTSDDLIMRSASGGAFSAIAAYVLEKGGAVCGAVSRGKFVKHIIIEKKQDLPLLQGSKYLQSDLTGIYKNIKKALLTSKTVLFSGTGCQVAGLLSFLGKKYDNLITIDLVCAGVPSLFVMERFCMEEKLNPTHIRWRDKENGWQHGLQLTVHLEDTQKKYPTNTCFFGGGFLNGLTNRKSCYDCKFCGSHRKADLTIADFWGISKYKEQQYKGISLLIAHSQKGLEISQSSQLELHPTTWAECLPHNPRIVYGKKLYALLIERKLLPYAFKHFKYTTLKAIYAGIFDKNFWWKTFYKIIRYARWRISMRIINKKVSKIIQEL